MPVEFRVTSLKAVFHNPLQNFELVEVPCEIRYDPLTGQATRLVTIRKPSLPPHDWTPFIEESLRRFCPFCPGQVEKATPRFPEELIPGGRLHLGEAVVVPNLNPYDKYSAVVIISPKHYLSMAELTPEVISNSFEAGQEFLKKVTAKDPAGSKYCSINWNYMPYSGGSLIHPHLQVHAGPQPTSLLALMKEKAAQYFKKNGNIYWADLLALEKEKGERYLGCTGNVSWLATFAPKALFDVVGIFPEKATVKDFAKKDLDELAAGFKKVIAFYERSNVASFNAGLYFGQDTDRGFWVTARIVARFTIFPLVGSDYSHLQVMHDEAWVMYQPEQMCIELAPSFSLGQDILP
jgi:galactose-1-phosphate uridylyltransferase